MIRTISIELVRDLLTKAGIAVVQDKDGRFLTVLKAKKQFNHDVVIRYILRGECLLMVGQASAYDVPVECRNDVILALNIHNMRRHTCAGALHDNTIMFKHSMLVDEDVSEEHILDNWVKAGTEGIWNAFVEFEKNSKDDEGHYKRYTLPVLGRDWI